MNREIKPSLIHTSPLPYINEVNGFRRFQLEIDGKPDDGYVGVSPKDIISLALYGTIPVEPWKEILNKGGFDTYIKPQDKFNSNKLKEYLQMDANYHTAFQWLKDRFNFLDNNLRYNNTLPVSCARLQSLYADYDARRGDIQHIVRNNEHYDYFIKLLQEYDEVTNPKEFITTSLAKTKQIHDTGWGLVLVTNKSAYVPGGIRSSPDIYPIKVSKVIRDISFKNVKGIITESNRINNFLNDLFNPENREVRSPY